MQHGEQIQFDHLLVEPRRGLGGGRERCAAGSVDHDVQPTVPFDDPIDQTGDSLGVAHVAGVELIRRPVDGTAGAGDDDRALGGEHLADAGTDPADATGDQNDALCQAEIHCASVPSKCLLRCRSASQRQEGHMTITPSTPESGIVAVTIDYPPVNAIPSGGWFELADAVTAAGRDVDTRVVILRAEGRGFNAGVDIKEMQNTPGFGALIDANRGCFAAFKAVYECAVPVVAAVNGFCVGGGIGLVGNADVIVASEDATFGLPEVERGALGAATHLSRLVPQHMMRRLFFTAATVDAATLHHFGSVHEVVPRAELDEAALRVAREIATKDTRVIRAAKEALNLIDVQRVNSSYRMEQGFTFELNLSGVSDELRDDFAGTKKATETR